MKKGMVGKRTLVFVKSAIAEDLEDCKVRL